MSEELQARFERAKGEILQLSQAPDMQSQLRLYTLFKQGTVGDCTGDRPGMIDFKGRAKYDAWKALAGMSKEDAMQAYIDLVEELKAADQAK
jgi:acyl-CoA-binding protein